MFASFSALPRWVRVAGFAGLAVTLMLTGVLVAASVVVHRPLPQTDGTLTLPGLVSDVEVIRDEYGVPHIYADTTADLMRAQGFVHAQDRFFEMDVRRHATAGRLAELFGEDAVESDAMVRTMGWRRVAEAELALVAPETREVLGDYADGVNAYLEQRSGGRLALEYAVLGVSGVDYTPEPWTEIDSLAWLKAMAWDLRSNLNTEIDRARTQLAVGEEQAAELFPEYPFDRNAPIVTSGAVVDDVFEPDASEPGTRDPRRVAPFEPADLSRRLDALSAGLDAMPAWLGRGDGIGSNSWVVSGDLTESGSPILANDPHLGVSLPGVWTQVGLYCRVVGPDCPYDVAGFSFSGLPGVIIGRNADIAWGLTNLAPDVTDLYVERIDEGRWLYDGEWLPLETRNETIEVEGGPDVDITVRTTRHGPLLSDVDDELRALGIDSAPPEAEVGEELGLSLAWTALEPGATADAILAMNRAADEDDFRAAAEAFAVPAQNLVYADRSGRIAYQAPGRIPIRKSGNDGRVPSAGWLPENDWTGDYVPFEALPRLTDPSDGVIVTANQAVVGPDYPFFLTDDWAYGYRSERIGRLLETVEGPVDVDSMLETQLDARHPLASDLVPRLMDVDLPRGYYSSGQALLRRWDYQQTPDSAAAAYFNVVWRELLAATFHDDLPEAVWPDGGSRWVAVVQQLLDEPDSPWWDDVDTFVTEDRDDVLRGALRRARDELTSRQSPVATEWRWGDLHELELTSQTLGSSGVGIVERLFNRGGWEIGGGSATVDATAWDAVAGYAPTSAPSMRMVVSLAPDELDDSRWINLTGVSGHAFSDHYTDQTELWARGETMAWPFSRDAVEAAGEDRLILEPDGP